MSLCSGPLEFSEPWSEPHFKRPLFWVYFSHSPSLLLTFFNLVSPYCYFHQGFVCATSHHQRKKEKCIFSFNNSLTFSFLLLYFLLFYLPPTGLRSIEMLCSILSFFSFLGATKTSLGCHWWKLLVGVVIFIYSLYLRLHLLQAWFYIYSPLVTVAKNQKHLLERLLKKQSIMYFLSETPF